MSNTNLILTQATGRVRAADVRALAMRDAVCTGSYAVAVKTGVPGTTVPFAGHIALDDVRTGAFWGSSAWSPPNTR